jgi:hypothetical protein
LLQSSEAERLAALQATLPARQREPIAMKYGAGMTNRAIARATGLSESNVGTTLHRAVEAAVVTVLISVPAVRASVAQFVSLFRVVYVVAIPVDTGRLDRLKAENLEIGALIGENVDIVQQLGPPVKMATLEEAAAAAGMTLAVPQRLPDNTQLLETSVGGERAARVTANSARLQQVLDALGINDLAVPPGLDGHVVNVHVPPVVTIRTITAVGARGWCRRVHRK